KTPSRQTVQSEQTIEYVLPPGSAVEVGGPGLQPISATAEQTAGATGGRTQAHIILEKAMPVRVLAKDRTETSIGAAQTDTAREWAAKAASMQPVMWAGLIMLTIVAGLLAYFGWWTKAALAVGVGLGMIVLAE